MRNTLIILALSYQLLVPAMIWAGKIHPAQTAQQLKIKQSRFSNTKTRIFQRVTIDIDLQGTFDNPFDQDDIRLDALITQPTGEILTVPGFYYQPFHRPSTADRRIEPAGPPRWQLRLSFPQPGKYQVRIRLIDRTGSVTSEPRHITVTSTAVPGMIRRHQADYRYFTTDSGETWFPVGANVCWGENSSRRGIFAYDDWFAKYAAQHCNYARIWLSLDWNKLATITRRSGYDRMDLENCWRMDHVLEQAEKYGIRLMLCLDAHGMLMTKKKVSGFWEDSPFYYKNGAPFKKPVEFFTNPQSRHAYRNRLRYLVARYGYSSNVFAWEFWNEVDLVDGYNSKIIADWHRDMARYLRKIDPWKHLLTTSFARPGGDAAVNDLPELDFVQTHHYRSRDITRALADDIRHKTAARNRPHFHGEFGISNNPRETIKLDPTGIHIHNALYSCVGQMQAGTPMSWWWDSYIDPLNLYPLYGSFNRWIEGFDFIRQHVRPVAGRVSWTDPTEPHPLMDFTLVPKRIYWTATPFAGPSTVTVHRNGTLDYDIFPAAILHGKRNHPNLHNPVTFILDTPQASEFQVEIGNVSGYGGARLSIYLDGKLKLQRNFIPSPNPEIGGSLQKFAGIYRVPLPAGRHHVKIEDTGNDWMMVKSYRIPKIISPAIPPLRIWGAIGDRQALIWIQNSKYTWFNVSRKNYEPYPVKNAALIIERISPGPWLVQSWDPQLGRVIRSRKVLVGKSETLLINLPVISRDGAFRLYKQKP